MKKPALLPSAGRSWGAVESSIPLVDRINTLHREVKEHELQGLLKARAAGELLLEAKAAVKHGEWLDWLAENADFSQKTAWQYMRIAECWSELEPFYTRGYNLTIRKALKLVRYGYRRGRK